MRDPAIEAAQRAAQLEPPIWGLATVAAREMAAPLRDLHKPYSPLWPEGVTDCDHCETPWPCDTAKLIYSTEELP